MKWKWDGEFHCEGLNANYVGTSKGLASRAEAAEGAMEDYFRNAHLTPDQLKEIENHIPKSID